ncbi:MAG: hypothetical protein K6F33_04660 [Bacteroidales bacterium]|nr:hypothetical protein [Bacteroidales bacterium]
MKNLATNHIAIKQSILSGLVNEKDLQQDARIKIGMLNNAIVFPVPYHFYFNDFAKALLSYINDTLHSSATAEEYGEDMQSIVFSPIGLGLMKKAVVFSLIDSHLYINIVPAKEIENPNFSEGKISELLSAGKVDKIYQFTEDFIMKLYPEAVANTVKPQGRYFYSTGPGIAPILASHIEDGEIVLAKLDIYRIDASKSNAQTSEVDSAFYVSTTKGSYLFVLDKNLQEKYIETLSTDPMKVKAEIGRDPVTCGSTKWMTNRDNDFLFDEVSRAHTLEPQDKLLMFSQLHYNMGENLEDREYASHLINIYAENDGSPFAKFAAKMIEFSVSLSGKSEVINKVLAMQLIEYANSLLSDNEFEKKIVAFVGQFNFSSLELMSIIFVISRIKKQYDDVKAFVEMMTALKKRFFECNNDSLDRAFVCISIAKKLNAIGAHKDAGKMAEEALDLCGDMSAATLAPGLHTTPDMPYAGPSLQYAALEELYAAAESDKDRYKFAIEMAMLKPLIESNLSNAIKFVQNDDIKMRLNVAMSVFDTERFANYSYSSSQALEGKFSKIKPSTFMPACMGRKKTFSHFEDWVARVNPDKSISSVKSYGELVNTNNYHLLFEFDENLTKYFETDVDVFILAKRNQGIISNDDGDTKYIIIDAELLDTDNANYMNGSELLFEMAREFASLRLGLSRLTCHPQWRNYSVNGVHSQDVISIFAPEPDFISSEVHRYTRILRFGELMSADNYFNFDIDNATSAAEILEQTINTLKFAGNSPDNIKEAEYAALSLLTAMIADRAGLVVSGNLVTSIKAMIHNDSQLKGSNADLSAEGTVASISCTRGTDGRPINYDFAMRLSALLSFYISTDYKNK